MEDLPILVSVVGARPQFVKLAPIVRALEKQRNCKHRIVHTGQHYDDKLSGAFFDQLELPKPDVDLGVGSASHGAQTAAMLIKLEEYLLQDKPRAVLTYGDTNSTLAATLAAAKLHIPTAHIEAGLRSFNRDMPEEINRLVADHCSDRLYAPTPGAIHNLEKENLADRAVQSGDVMLDAVIYNVELANAKSQALEEYGVEDCQFGLVTVHRPVNTTGKALRTLLKALEFIAENHLPLIFPAHPRTQAVLQELEYKAGARLQIVDAVPYLDIVTLIQAATVVITDSGGMQKEAAFLKTPCLTMRDETEWTETVDMGVNRLVGNSGSNLIAAFPMSQAPENVFSKSVQQRIEKQYGTGNAAALIVKDCLEWMS
jgi:UDP-N-acetylglucosamine 2-epimerase